MLETLRDAQLTKVQSLEAELLGLLEGMDYCLDWKPDPNSWSVREVVYHLLDTPAGGVHTILQGILSGELTEFEVWADRTNMTPERQACDINAVLQDISALFRGIEIALQSSSDEDLTGKSALAHLRSYGREDQRTGQALLDGLLARHWGEHLGQIKELRETLGV